jgi:hypothetical protein
MMNGAQLVQDLIDGARQANAQVEVGPMDPGVLFKTAGAQAALEDLGLSDMEKEAIWSSVLRPALGALWKHTGGKLISGVAKPMSWAGQKAVGQIGKVSPGAAKFLSTAGRGAARDAASFGLLSGGLNAATAEPGDRLSAFGRGFAGGALGGAAWRMGGSAARMGLGKALGTTAGGASRMGNLYRAGRHGWFGGGLKGFGAKAVTSGVPLAGALGASMMMPTFDSQQQAQQRPQGMPYTPGQMYGAGRMLYAGY